MVSSFSPFCNLLTVASLNTQMSVSGYICPGLPKAPRLPVIWLKMSVSPASPFPIYSSLEAMTFLPPGKPIWCFK